MDNETKDTVLAIIKEIQSALKPIHFSDDLKLTEDVMDEIYNCVGSAYEAAIEIEELLTGER